MVLRDKELNISGIKDKGRKLIGSKSLGMKVGLNASTQNRSNTEYLYAHAELM
jgi:hypothetical protein